MRNTKKSYTGKPHVRLASFVLLSLFLFASLQIGLLAGATGLDGGSPDPSSGGSSGDNLSSLHTPSEEPGDPDSGNPALPGNTDPDDTALPGNTDPDDAALSGNTDPDDTALPGDTDPDDTVLPGDTDPDDTDLLTMDLLSIPPLPTTNVSIEVVLLGLGQNDALLSQKALADFFLNAEMVVSVDGSDGWFYQVLSPKETASMYITSNSSLRTFYAPPGFVFEGFRASDKDSLSASYRLSVSSGDITVQAVYSVQRAFVSVPTAVSQTVGEIEPEPISPDNEEVPDEIPSPNAGMGSLSTTTTDPVDGEDDTNDFTPSEGVTPDALVPDPVDPSED